MNNSLVSVIIPTYNRAELLLRAVSSVLAQTYSNLECLVVDDASTDETERVVKGFQDRRVIYLRHETNKHASASRNTGIEYAKGELIAFLDSDDEWLPAKLEKQVALMGSLPDTVGMVYCWLDYIDGEGRVIQHHSTLRGYVFPQVLDVQRLGNASTLLVRRPVIETIGGFDESLPRGNDGDFIRRVSLTYEVDVVPEMLVKVHTGHGYEQITRSDESGINNAIRSQKIKLAKFAQELSEYPKQASNIYAMIAYHYSQLHDWRNSIAFYRKAIVAYPFSDKVYLWMLRSLRHCMKRTAK